MALPSPAAASGRDCPACGGRLEPWRWGRASDPGLAGAERYPLLRCPSCGTATLAQRRDPADPALYERGTYAPSRPLVRLLLRPLRRASEWQRLRLLSGLPAGAEVFEVGAGSGSFLKALARRGYRAAGADPAAPAEPPAGQRLERARAEELQLPPGSRQAIVLWHVLEHLDDPAACLRRLTAAVAPGGLILVGTPNLAGLQARLGGDRWFHQDLPRHAILFSESGLRILLGRSGLAVERVSHLVLDQNLLGMWQTLLNRLTLEPDVSFRLAKRHLPHAGRGRAALDVALSALAGALLAAPAVALELAADAARRGGTVAVVARRPGGAA
jgi:SAM-dependent methyltransferase